MASAEAFCVSYTSSMAFRTCTASASWASSARNKTTRGHAAPLVQVMWSIVNFVTPLRVYHMQVSHNYCGTVQHSFCTLVLSVHKRSTHAGCQASVATKNNLNLWSVSTLVQFYQRNFLEWFQKNYWCPCIYASHFSQAGLRGFSTHAKDRIFVRIIIPIKAHWLSGIMKRDTNPGHFLPPLPLLQIPASLWASLLLFVSGWWSCASDQTRFQPPVNVGVFLFYIMKYHLGFTTLSLTHFKIWNSFPISGSSTNSPFLRHITFS